MFGINDDRAADQPRHDDQDDQQVEHSDGASDSQQDSPFAAAYSSLSTQDDDSRPSAPTTQTSASSVPEEDLLQIKTQALTSLAPLVNHLDQSPEEKFKTTMMMIQASDNADLIRDAYQAAGQIEDEKSRAQALLDVINEINYFTQRGKN